MEYALGVNANNHASRAERKKDLVLSLLHNTQFVHFIEQGKEYLYASVDGKKHWAVRLAEQESLRKLLFTRPDLTPFMAITGTKRDNLPCMTDSLRLIIADMIALGRQQLAGWAERNAVDVALLTLAGEGLASIRKNQADNWICVQARS
jgi:hypothetical protein